MDTIKIKCKGVLGRAEAIIKNKKIHEIKIMNPGKDYTSTPKIIISKPDGYVYCHLCCKN